MKSIKIPEVTINRLAVYARFLKTFKKSGKTITSSREIANIIGSTSAQVRKDLAYFGEFGVKGVGYEIDGLYNAINNILGLDKIWNIAIIGAGNLGEALIKYPGFLAKGFDTVAIFDADPQKIGNVEKGLVIHDIKDFKAVAEETNVHIVAIVVPDHEAQGVANLVVESGIKAILNFAPFILNTPLDVEVKNIDVSVYLESLSYFLMNSKSMKENNKL